MFSINLVRLLLLDLLPHSFLLQPEPLYSCCNPTQRIARQLACLHQLLSFPVVALLLDMYGQPVADFG